MSCGAMTVKCDDGFQVITKNQGELVQMVQMHVQSAHNRAVTESDVMAMAKHP